jgi:hypothetical protein
MRPTLTNKQPFNNLLEKGWAKKQPFRKRLGQKQPFRKRLDQKTTF